MGRPIWTVDTATSHARWLHELRSAVSTAGVAASVGRELLGPAPAPAHEALREAEAALAQCRALLEHATEHLRADAGARPAPPPGAAATRIRSGGNAWTEGPQQRRRIDRLDEVVVEAGVAREAQVAVLPVTGERDEHGALALRTGA